MRMCLGDEYRQLPRGATHITHRPISREIELLSKRTKVSGGDAGHRVHELLEPFGPAIELGEHRRASMLDLVLWIAGAESFREIAPKAIQTSIAHFEES